MEGKQKTGAIAEGIAVGFLEHKGYTVIARNVTYKFGEVDIIAWHDKPYGGKTLCFIEVKFRSVNDGSAERSVGTEKQGRMKKSAIAFCLEQGIESETTPIQFEQVSIYGKGTARKIFHYEILNT